MIVISAPVDGVYYFNVNLLGDAQDIVSCYIRVDDQRRAYSVLRIPEGVDQTAAISILLVLNVGQTVNVENNVQTMVHGINNEGELYSWFAGYLLRAT